MHERGREGSQGDLTFLARGSHLCALYEDRGLLDRIATSFVRSGLAAGDRVMYVTSERRADEVIASLDAAEVPASPALRTGQLQVAAFADHYGRPDLAEMAKGFRAAGWQARADGFPALRVAAEMGDFAARVGSAEQMLRWERIASRLQREEAISSVCLYERGGLAEDVADALIREHQAVAPTDAPPPAASFLATEEGLLISGEVDLSNRSQLLDAIRARSAVAARISVDLRDLGYIDAGSLRALRDGASAGAIRIVNAPPRVRTMMLHTGLDDEGLVLD